jgi:signal transduction histidine kinase
MIFHAAIARISPYLQPQRSLGSRLFLSVLGIAFLGLGSTSYLLYANLEKRSAEAIALNLENEVVGMEKQIQAAEQLMRQASISYRSLDRQNVHDLEAYKQLAFELYQQRSSVVMGVGFGGGSAIDSALDNPLHWPYFLPHQANEPDQVGKQLPEPNQADRYVDVCQMESCEKQDYYHQPIKAGKSIWLAPYPWHGLTLTTITEPIYNDRHQLIGLTGIDLNLTNLTKQIDRPVTANKGHFALLGSQGDVLAHPQIHKGKEKLTSQKVAEFKAIWPKIQAQKEAAGLLRHQGQYWAYRRIPGPDWVMLAIVPELSVLQPVILITAGSAIVVGGLLAGVLLLFTQRLNRQLRPMLVTCERLAQDEGSSEPIQGDELQVLSVAFHRMTQQLQDSFTALEAANQELEGRVDQRTLELSQALYDLQQAQSQLVQSERMSSLGQLVAGIAHEVNNPISFIHGNLKPAMEATQHLIDTINLYQSHYPNNAHPAIAQQLETIELAFLVEDLPKMFQSMKAGTTRVQNIVQNLRNFSRLDETGHKAVNLHDSLDSTLLILQHLLQPQGSSRSIQVVKQYGELPLVTCYPGQMNQVFLNILTNAIEALERSTHLDRRIEITTKPQGDSISITLTNNGPTIDQSIAQQLFDPFFTTKPVGSGTGMGLAISYQAVERHGGRLQLDSRVRSGASFIIELPIVCPVVVQTPTPTAMVG